MIQHLNFSVVTVLDYNWIIRNKNQRKIGIVHRNNRKATLAVTFRKPGQRHLPRKRRIY